MKISVSSLILIVSLIFISFVFQSKAPDSIKLFLNGKEVEGKISFGATGKLEIILPEGWRYISGKIKILNGDEVKLSKQIIGEAGLKDFDLLGFIKTNGVVGNHLSLELSVRTKESGTLSTMKIPIVE